MPDEAYLGEIKMVGFNFAPRGYAFCEGQIMTISQNTALFALLGTMYGGDGRNTFALPDFRGRVPTSFGKGPGLPGYVQGEHGGSPFTTLLIQNLPAHTHAIATTVNSSASFIPASSGEGDSDTPAPDKVLAKMSNGLTSVKGYTSTRPDTTLSPIGIDATVSAVAANTGNNTPFDNQQPYLVVNFIICIDGIFPSRN